MDIHSMDTHSPNVVGSIALVPDVASPYAYGTSVAPSRLVIHREEVRGHAQEARRFGPLPPSSLPPSSVGRSAGRSQEQNASLESVMVERENVVMEGENRSHGGEDDQTFWTDSQRHLLLLLFITST